MLPFSGVTRPLTEPCGLGFAQLRRLSDEALMQHLALGHDDALAVLHDRYHRLVFGICLKVLRDRGEAQDVSQEVFLKLYRTVAQFDAAKGRTRMWILQFAYQLSFNRRRYLALRSFCSVAPDADLQEWASPGSDARLLPAEAASLVRGVLAQVSERQRRTIELACYEGLSMAEIAARTGESVGNIRHQYYRGIAKLRTVLGERSADALANDGEVADASARQLA